MILIDRPLIASAIEIDPHAVEILEVSDRAVTEIPDSTLILDQPATVGERNILSCSKKIFLAVVKLPYQSPALRGERNRSIDPSQLLVLDDGYGEGDLVIDPLGDDIERREIIERHQPLVSDSESSLIQDLSLVDAQSLHDHVVLCVIVSRDADIADLPFLYRQGENPLLDLADGETDHDVPGAVVEVVEALDNPEEGVVVDRPWWDLTERALSDLVRKEGHPRKGDAVDLDRFIDQPPLGEGPQQADLIRGCSLLRDDIHIGEEDRFLEAGEDPLDRRFLQAYTDREVYHLLRNILRDSFEAADHVRGNPPLDDLY